MPAKPRRSKVPPATPTAAADFSESDPPREPAAEAVTLPAITDDVLPPDARGPDDEELTRIIGAIVRGLPELELMQFIARDMPNLSPKHALQKAMIKIAENADADPTFVFAWSFEAARFLYRQLVGIGEYTEALKTLKFINDTAARMAVFKTAKPNNVSEPDA